MEQKPIKEQKRFRDAAPLRQSRTGGAEAEPENGPGSELAARCCYATRSVRVLRRKAAETVLEMLFLMTVARKSTKIDENMLIMRVFANKKAFVAIISAVFVDSYEEIDEN